MSNPVLDCPSNKAKYGPHLLLVIIPVDNSTLRIRWFHWSQMNKFPAASNVIPAKLEKVASDAAPSSPPYPSVPVPAMVLIIAVLSNDAGYQDDERCVSRSNEPHESDRYACSLGDFEWRLPASESLSPTH